MGTTVMLHCLIVYKGTYFSKFSLRLFYLGTFFFAQDAAARKSLVVLLLSKQTQHSCLSFYPVPFFYFCLCS